jgi:hypothetical protein
MAAYRFAVTVRLDHDGLAVDPDTFETTVRKPAPEPGTEGWHFFRNAPWHGEISDPGPFEKRLEERLGVEIVECDFRAFECTPDERAALKSEIEAHIDDFGADTADGVVHDHFGSSLEVAENT